MVRKLAVNIVETTPGPCQEVAALACDVLNGMLTRIIERVDERCCTFRNELWDHPNCGYELSDVFELVCWILYGRSDSDLFTPVSKIESIVKWSIQTESQDDDADVAHRLVLAWYSREMDQLSGAPVATMPFEKVSELLVPVLTRHLEKYMTCIGERIESDRIKEQHRLEEEEERKRREEFEYDGDDMVIEYVLDELCNTKPDDAILNRAREFVRKFFDKELTGEEESCSFSIHYEDDGESRYVDFDLCEDRLAVTTGGSSASDCGTDSFSDEVWSIDAYEHATGDCNVDGVAIELLNLGAEVKDDL